jgi:branched-chain amino acid transport system substrate-binding protein
MNYFAINARVSVEGLKHAGRDLTWDKCVTALEAMGKVNDRGYVVSFSKSNHQGSPHVESTVITKNGRFLR